MIDELLHWPVRNRNLLKLGRQVEEINIEFAKLDQSLANATPNIHRARSLDKKISDRLCRARRLKPSSAFEKLVLRSHIDSLFCQSEYLKLFFFKNYNKDYGVRELIKYIFQPENEWDNGNNAVDYLESILRGVDWKKITKREDLMWEVETYQLPNYHIPVRLKIEEEIRKIKEALMDFDLDREFITARQYDILNAHEQKREAKRTFARIKSVLGPLFGDASGILVKLLCEAHPNIKEMDKPEQESSPVLSDLMLDINFVEGESAYFDSNTKQMELNDERFYYYVEKKADKVRLYAGDLYPAAWHENVHRFQKYFSRHMPPGLRETDGEYSIASRTIQEGVAIFSEEWFIDYMENNKRKLGLTKKDIERAKYEDHVYLAKKIIQFCHAMYHREVLVEGDISGRESDYDVHQRLAQKSGNWALIDTNYLDDDPFCDHFYDLFYIFGKKAVRQTVKALENTETKKLGTRRKAKNFIRRNENIVLQGMMTGSWSWSTHGEFFLEHYWPKARKYCEE
jgi:hypothetical protein